MRFNHKLINKSEIARRLGFKTASGVANRTRDKRFIRFEGEKAKLLKEAYIDLFAYLFEIDENKEAMDCLTGLIDKYVDKRT